jgi:hypothetical protein
MTTIQENQIDQCDENTSNIRTHSTRTTRKSDMSLFTLSRSGVRVPQRPPKSMGREGPDRPNCTEPTHDGAPPPAGTMPEGQPQNDLLLGMRRHAEEPFGNSVMRHCAVHGLSSRCTVLPSVAITWRGPRSVTLGYPISLGTLRPIGCLVPFSEIGHGYERFARILGGAQIRRSDFPVVGEANLSAGRRRSTGSCCGNAVVGQELATLRLAPRPEPRHEARPRAVQS